MKNKIVWILSLIFSAICVFVIQQAPGVANVSYYFFLCLLTMLLSEIIYAEVIKALVKFSCLSSTPAPAPAPVPPTTAPTLSPRTIPKLNPRPGKSY